MFRSECSGQSECGLCTVDVNGSVQLACQTKPTPGMAVKVVDLNEMPQARTAVTKKMKEASQIADFVIEHLDHIVNELSGESLAAEYDMTGKVRPLAESFLAKVGHKKVVRLLEGGGGKEGYLHVDKAGLDDFDTLVIARLLRFKANNVSFTIFRLGC